MTDEVVVQGLKEFRKACLALQENKDFAAAMKRVAEIVASDARGRAPHVTGAFGRSIRANAAGAGARVVWGGTRVAYAGWLDFGGRKHGSKQKVVDRPRIKEGRYVYPAIERNRDKVEAGVLAEMNVLVRRYGLDVE